MSPEPDSSTDDERALIERVLAGDEAAFRALYHAHAPALYRLALRLLGGRIQSTEDVLQETWRRAVQRLHGFERRAPLGAWLSGIVVRCALEQMRWELRAGEPLPLPDELPQPNAVETELRIDLERAFESLPAGYRAVLVLHDIEGYTHAAIGDLLGIDTGTSKSQLSRARASLRRALGATAHRSDSP